MFAAALPESVQDIMQGIFLQFLLAVGIVRIPNSHSVWASRKKVQPFAVVYSRVAVAIPGVFPL